MSYPSLYTSLHTPLGFIPKGLIFNFQWLLAFRAPSSKSLQKAKVWLHRKGHASKRLPSNPLPKELNHGFRSAMVAFSVLVPSDVVVFHLPLLPPLEFNAEQA